MDEYWPAHTLYVAWFLSLIPESSLVRMDLRERAPASENAAVTLQNYINKKTSKNYDYQRSQFTPKQGYQTQAINNSKFSREVDH